MLLRLSNCCLIALITMALLFLFISCEEDGDDEALITELLATFSGDWLCSDCDPGILVYSDLEGNVLWSGSWSGNDTLLATLEDGFPERLIFTTVTYDSRNERVAITSNMNVKADSYTWLGGGADYRWSEYVGDAYLKFRNVPEHSGYLIASKYSYRRSGGGSLHSPYDKALYNSDDNLFARINPIDGVPLYTWVQEISPWDSVTVDFANAVEMDAKTITIPNPEMETNYTIRGFISDYYEGYYTVDYASPWQITENTYEVHYPANLFSDYRFYGFINEESYPTRNYWSYSKMGDIPSGLEMLSTEFSFVNSDTTDVSISVSGDYTQISYAWAWQDHNGVSYSWNVYTDLEGIRLPVLPSSVLSAYPDLNPDSLSLSAVGVHQNDDLNYDEHIDLFFKSGDGFYNVITESKVRYKDPAGLRLE